MATKGSYEHNSMVEWGGGGGGGIPNFFLLGSFLRKLVVSDKNIHRAFRTHTTLQTKPIREIFNLHHLPKLYIGFNSDM